MARTILTDHLTLNVTKQGNDTTGDGSLSSPFLTIQHAIKVVYETLDVGGEYWVKIQVGDGTWAENIKVAYPLPGAGEGSYLRISGNVTTPANCFLKPTSNECVKVYYWANVEIEGFRFEAPTRGIYAYDGGIAEIVGKCEFGPCANHIYAAMGGEVKLHVPYDVAGGAANHFICNGAHIALSSAVNIAQPNLSFSNAFIQADRGADINLRTSSFTGQTASVTGKRWASDGNAIIRMSAGVNPDTHIPGNANGTKTFGGEAG